MRKASRVSPAVAVRFIWRRLSTGLPGAAPARRQQLGETSLMFLVHPTLSESDIGDTISAVQKVMEHAAT